MLPMVTMCAMSDTARHRNELATLLLRCRTERKMTLEQVAKAVGITKKTVSNIERRLFSPRRTTRLRLVEFLRKHGYFPKSEAA